MKKAILIKPLDGRPEGSRIELENANFKVLKEMGAVRLATVEEGGADDDGGDERPELVHARELQVANDRAETFRLQVIDTCSRAEKAEAEIDRLLGDLQSANERADTAVSDLLAANGRAEELAKQLHEKEAPSPENKVEQDPTNKAEPAPVNKAAAKTAAKRD